MTVSTPVLLLLLVVITAVVISMLSKKKMKKITEGAFHVKDGVLVTHESTPIEIPIASITAVSIVPYGQFLVDKKEQVIIQYGDGQKAKFLLEYAIEKEIALIKEELIKHGNDAPVIQG